jgi:23S rRNA U2552 (ribose-2'-O)-methylase RlmE/FtsJ
MTQANYISYKDTAARVVLEEGVYYRYIFNEYKQQYDAFMQSGLYETLKAKGYLIAHSELKYEGNDATVYKQLLPEQIHFQSYPFCWSYTQWRKAIITYLEINKIALSYGMILKDATPFNFFFKEGRAVLLDTSSFEFFKEGAPWLAYKQFCAEFLSPIALMHYNGQIWSSMVKANLKGLPLNFVSKQLPLKSWFNLTCLLHIHMHAKYANTEASVQQENTRKSKVQEGFTKEKLLSLIDMILSTVKKWKQAYHLDKNWQGYYEHDIESPIYLNQKEEIIKKWLSDARPKTVIDLGANTGRFSLLAAKEVEQVIALESDYNCVDAIENTINKEALKNIMVMQMDLAETTPNFGALEKEYRSIFQRLSNSHLSPSLVMGLAIVHHLHISSFLSFSHIAELFAKFNSKYLIVEFVPIEDCKVQLLIKNKQRNFTGYTQENFTAALLKYFKLIEVKKIQGSKRELLFLENIESGENVN